MMRLSEAMLFNEAFASILSWKQEKETTCKRDLPKIGDKTLHLRIKVI